MPRTTHRRAPPADVDRLSPAIVPAAVKKHQRSATTGWWLHLPPCVPLAEAAPDWSAPPFGTLSGHDLTKKKRAFAEWRRQQLTAPSKRRRSGGAAAAAIDEPPQPPQPQLQAEVTCAETARRAAQRRADAADQRAAVAAAQLAAEREERALALAVLEARVVALHAQLRDAAATRTALEQRVAWLEERVAEAAPAAWSPQAEWERTRAEVRGEVVERRSTPPHVCAAPAAETPGSPLDLEALRQATGGPRADERPVTWARRVLAEREAAEAAEAAAHTEAAGARALAQLRRPARRRNSELYSELCSEGPHPARTTRPPSQSLNISISPTRTHTRGPALLGQRATHPTSTHPPTASGVTAYTPISCQHSTQCPKQGSSRRSTPLMA